jgi:hydrogenase maturation protease
MTVPDSSKRRTPLTIIGLGNELLSDDGVGIRVVRELKTRLAPGVAAFEELSVGGLELLEYLVGSEQCVIIDALVTGRHPAGTAYRFIQKADRGPVTLTSSHQIDLAQVLSLAAMLGADLPRTLTVYGIEAADVTTFHDACTPAVSQAIPKVVDAVCRDLEGGERELRTRTGEWQIINDVCSD